jgi:spore coat protein U-like protein
MSMRRRFARFAPWLCVGVAAAAALAAVRPAAAGTPDRDLFVSATVESTCTISVSPVVFGAYSPSSALNATAQVSVSCSRTSPNNIGLDAGKAAGATVTTRRMTNGVRSLAYSLYQDPGRTTNWGETAGRDAVSGRGESTPQTVTVYGHVPAGQASAAGAVSDAVMVTVTF